MFNKNKHITLLLATGVGKSKITIDLIKHYNIDTKNVLLVVAETSHKDNWKKEFIKWNIEFKGIVECYHSLKNHKDKHYDLIVFDEAHHIFSDLRLDILDEIKFNQSILLSATLPDDKIKLLEERLNIKYDKIKISLKQAIQYGILPNPEINILRFDLDNRVINQECIIQRGKKDKLVYLECDYKDRFNYPKDKYPNLYLKIKCTEYQKYEWLSSQIEYWRKQFFITRNKFNEIKWLNLGSERKRFLGDCKTKHLKPLIEQLEDYRFICFCSSIEQAEQLSNNTIHSKKDNRFEILEQFNNKEINNIFCIGMLQEGTNLVDIEVGIITQLDGIERGFVQKFGRTLRSSKPIQYILVFNNTQDEKYLENVELI